jgi:hypothetical protein
MGCMSSDENSSASGRRPRIWIWLLLIVLGILMLVPAASIGLALKKTGLFSPKGTANAGSSQAPLPLDEGDRRGDFSSLRATLEKAASRVLEAPLLKSTMRKVQIVAPSPSIEVATQSIHEILGRNHQQYVEAVDPDKIRVIVVLKSKDWPALSEALRTSAVKNGFIYMGPSQTETYDQPDTMLAEIEILRKPAPAKK